MNGIMRYAILNILSFPREKRASNYTKAWVIFQYSQVDKVLGWIDRSF